MRKRLQWRVWTNFTLKQVSGRNQRLLINLWWIFVLWIFFLQFKDKQLLFINNFCLSVSQIFTIKAFCQSNYIWHMLIYLFMELISGNFKFQWNIVSFLFEVFESKQTKKPHFSVMGEKLDWLRLKLGSGNQLFTGFTGPNSTLCLQRTGLLMGNQQQKCCHTFQITCMFAV